MKKCVRNLVFVFDLDKTLGYFTQVAIFIEGVEHYLGRKLKKNDVNRIFYLFPERKKTFFSFFQAGKNAFFGG